MKTVLIIEDNTDNRENIREIFELGGYNVISGENGKAGLALAIKNKPDIIICDIMMPVMDGYEVLTALKNDPVTLNIPFIFITSMTEKENIAKGVKMGADGYATKPFDVQGVLNEVKSILSKKFNQKKTLTIS